MLDPAVIILPKDSPSQSARSLAALNSDNCFCSKPASVSVVQFHNRVINVWKLSFSKNVMQLPQRLVCDCMKT